MDLPLLAWIGEGQAETEWHPPLSGRRQPTPHAHRCHGVRVSGGRSMVTRLPRPLGGLQDALPG
ncbi:MAG TPA: hypothetical protein VE844_09790, partial [Gammaproteobacteria bacterium]|nr:hypothetical protein [Gammaproteobacteria bacterium]